MVESCIIALCRRPAPCTAALLWPQSLPRQPCPPSTSGRFSETPAQRDACGASMRQAGLARAAAEAPAAAPAGQSLASCTLDNLLTTQVQASAASPVTVSVHHAAAAACTKCILPCLPTSCVPFLHTCGHQIHARFTHDDDRFPSRSQQLW